MAADRPESGSPEDPMVDAEPRVRVVKVRATDISLPVRLGQLAAASARMRRRAKTVAVLTPAGAAALARAFPLTVSARNGDGRRELLAGSWTHHILMLQAPQIAVSALEVSEASAQRIMEYAIADTFLGRSLWAITDTAAIRLVDLYQQSRMQGESILSAWLPDINSEGAIGEWLGIDRAQAFKRHGAQSFDLHAGTAQQEAPEERSAESPKDDPESASNGDG